jgi:hypothetical protein
MSLANERRGSDRHEPVDNRIIVQVTNWAGLQVRRARLVNFSSTGGLILTDPQPTLNQRVFVRIEALMEIGWFAGVSVRFGRSNEVGIKFRHPFPLDFLPNSMSESEFPLVADTDDEPLYHGEANPDCWGLPEENR